jgi:hypothetical protein
VAYEWMNTDASDHKAHLSAMQGLPEESIQVLTNWLDGALTEQQRADLLVAQLVRGAREYVAGKRPGSARGLQGTRLSATLAEDVARQDQWLQAEARARGFKDAQDLQARDYPLFERLGELWRKKNPADSLLSRTGLPLVSPQSQLDEAIRQAGVGLQKAIDNKRGTDMVMLGRSPHVLSMIGGSVPNPLPMVITPNILDKFLSPTGKHYPKVAEALMSLTGEEMARALYRPAAVVEDLSEDGNFTLVTNILTPTGPLVANVSTNKVVRLAGKPQTVVHVNSIYPRDDNGVSYWLGGTDEKRVVRYVDPMQIGEAVTGRLNPENKNPAFQGRDYVLAKGAIDGVAHRAFDPTAPISNTSNLSKFGTPVNSHYRGLATVQARLNKLITGKGLKPGAKKAKTYQDLSAWIDKQYKGEESDKPKFSRAPSAPPQNQRWFRGRVADGPLRMRGGVAYFTPDQDAARSYIWQRIEEGYDGPGSVMEVELTLRNPASEDDIRRVAEKNGIDLLHPDYPAAYLDGSPELVAALKAEGYDGAMGLDGRPDTGKEIQSAAVFSPEQVREPNRGRAAGDGNARLSRTQDQMQAEAARGPLPPTIDVDGKQRSTSNSDGDPIHSTQEGVRNFWRWFGNSKVVDERGRPMVVYHGTDRRFNEFKPQEGLRGSALTGKVRSVKAGAFYFTPDEAYARSYGEAKNSVENYLMPVYLKADYLAKMQSFADVEEYTSDTEQQFENEEKQFWQYPGEPRVPGEIQGGLDGCHVRVLRRGGVRGL